MSRERETAREVAELLLDGDVLAVLADVVASRDCLSPLDDAGARCGGCVLCRLSAARGEVGAHVAREVIAAALRSIARELDAAMISGVRLLRDAGSTDAAVRAMAMTERVGAFAKAAKWRRAVRLAARRAGAGG